MAQKFLNGIDVSSTTVVNGSNLNSGSTVLDVQGSQGQLFSVTNSLTGDLFSVSDISGIPILNVNSSGAVDIDGTLSLGDSDKIQLGASQDLQIYHDGSHSYIRDQGSGNLIITGSQLTFSNVADTEYMVKMVQDGTVELYYNGSKKLETTSAGVTVTGEIQLNTKALLSNQENTDVDTGAETVASVAIATYTAAFFDFVIKKGLNVRSGTVYACHDGTNVEFTETSTQDLGDTSDVTLSVDISGGNMRLLATVTSDNWSVKSLIRAI